MSRMKTFFIYLLLFVGLYVVSNLLIDAYIKTSYYKIETYDIDVKEANIKDYIEKHDISQNFALEDGDILYIPKSNKIDFHKDVLPLINVYSTYRALTD